MSSLAIVPDRSVILSGNLTQSQESIASLFRGISHRVERVMNSEFRLQWVELLVVDSQNPLSPKNLLQEAKDKGVTGKIFELWLMKAFTRIARPWLRWWNLQHLTTSVNAYITDLSWVDFQSEMMKLIWSYKREDRQKIIIELLEEPHGKEMRAYIQNVNWLKNQWFLIAIDDYDLMEVRWDMSRRNLWLFWSNNGRINVVDRIKLDHTITKKLLMWDPLAMRKLSELRKKYPQISIVTEWISKDPVVAHSQIATLKPLGITYFQIYSWPWE